MRVLLMNDRRTGSCGGDLIHSKYFSEKFGSAPNTSSLEIHSVLRWNIILPRNFHNRFSNRKQWKLR